MLAYRDVRNILLCLWYCNVVTWFGSVVVRALDCEFNCQKCTATLVLGWATICVPVNHLGTI